MKLKYLPFIFLIFLSVSLSHCAFDAKEGGIAYYTCPMHPQIRLDNPGQCPICTMDLVPVKKDAGIKHDLDSGDGAEEGVRINPTYVQNIGIKIEEVKVRDLVKVINTHGKVAHDARLWVAQNEYIQSLKLGDRSLIKSAELKLEFLGLSREWIALLKKNRKADITLHIESKSGPNYFEAFIYQEDIEVS